MSAKRLPLTVVDYGLGNLHSLSRALRRVGAADFAVTSDPEIIAAADRAILPGVGAFADGMAGLRERGLVDAVRAFAASGKPLLGICLGMQLMMEEGVEFGRTEGLGIIKGKCVEFPNKDGLKIPHVGWNGLRGEGWGKTVLNGLDQGEQVYFLHSYIVVPADPKASLATAQYGSSRFCAALSVGKITAAQFHPEKSGAAGLHILSNFLERYS